MNPLRLVEGEDASGPDREMFVGWGEENETGAKRLAVLSIPDRERAGAAKDLGQLAWTH
jgi:hypothetical protein